jgi:hypothetical protein
MKLENQAKLNQVIDLVAEIIKDERFYSPRLSQSLVELLHTRDLLLKTGDN